jgi:hypothetical protein
LIENGAVPSHSITHCIIQANVEKFHYLLSKGANRNFTFAGAHPPIMRSLLSSDSTFYEYYKRQDDFLEQIKEIYQGM